LTLDVAAAALPELSDLVAVPPQPAINTTARHMPAAAISVLRPLEAIGSPPRRFPIVYYFSAVHATNKDRGPREDLLKNEQSERVKKVPIERLSD
jgi:hypothetical protein